MTEPTGPGENKCYILRCLCEETKPITAADHQTLCAVGRLRIVTYTSKTREHDLTESELYSMQQSSYCVLNLSPDLC